MIYYALRHKKFGLLGISVTSNGNAEFCNQYSAEFTPDDENPWLTNDKENAINLLENRTPWYNSSVYHPENPYKKKDLEIVDCEVKI